MKSFNYLHKKNKRVGYWKATFSWIMNGEYMARVATGFIRRGFWDNGPRFVYRPPDSQKIESELGSVSNGRFATSSWVVNMKESDNSEETCSCVED